MQVVFHVRSIHAKAQLRLMQAVAVNIKTANCQQAHQKLASGMEISKP